ncbi:hypothetical protein NDU88_011207 [Pleurodeles waltl]|uniref:Uncharacterized protein n=1 Tax=Pleurodeles waltl TaxID=8319 RepID=A0AAV7S0G1_PLEWA|nr:hypothetical protein NDU88_011207 [Pleurodeles waltl]
MGGTGKLEASIGRRIHAYQGVGRKENQLGLRKVNKYRNEAKGLLLREVQRKLSPHHATAEMLTRAEEKNRPKRPLSSERAVRGERM